ncbi:nucleotidyltransferase domain-containing protein [Nitrospirillum iridis]|uniref:Putative nucleotidyltransferase n=1 Tax=Nitrospirillum iridis TaxID=765888 RepID=A0A7X0B1X3_9PROT|nr:nucleotidyltransferase domain-containing protein [Nitrospirillum iridis]MBB6254195.1 putative nucleotidyltransferase [Nitrospirillum iridis]
MTVAHAMNKLETAIYSTIAYRDIFHFPVSVFEIHRYLHGIRCTLGDVQHALAGPILGHHLESDGTYHALRGRADLFAIRRTRAELSRRQWPTARRHARFLASLPNVRMVAMTGSLAAGNFPPDGDIDFLLVTDAGTMWRTRAFCRLLALADTKLARGLFCPNTFLSLAALPLARRSLYDAQELCQMIPLHGLDTYDAVREANAWTAEWLPNAMGAPLGGLDCRPYAPRVKRAGEWLLDSPMGRMLEGLEARRKIHRFNETDRLKGAWTRSTKESHSLWDEMRLKIEAAWQARMDELADG